MNSTLQINKNSNLGVFGGYASVFNRIDSQSDLIKPGAFAETIRKRRVVLLWQHGIKDPIGKIVNIVEDSFGLFIVAKLNLKLHKARDAYHMIQDGIINSFSIGYRALEAQKAPTSMVRVITKIDLWEISLVTFPANEMAKITNHHPSPN